MIHAVLKLDIRETEARNDILAVDRAGSITVSFETRVIAAEERF